MPPFAGPVGVARPLVYAPPGQCPIVGRWDTCRPRYSQAFAFRNVAQVPRTVRCVGRCDRSAQGDSLSATAGTVELFRVLLESVPLHLTEKTGFPCRSAPQGAAHAH